MPTRHGVSGFFVAKLRKKALVEIVPGYTLFK